MDYVHTMSGYTGTGLSSRPPLQTTEDMQHLLTQAKARLHAYLKAGRPMGREETHGFFHRNVWVT